jgi:LPXTG-motif cell wall-anchored protein
MNLAHLHLILNHLPVLGVPFGLALLGYGLWRRSDELKRTALAVLLLAALVTVPVYFTGEPAEDVVKGLPGVSRPLLSRHEDAATTAFVVVGIAGLAALAGLLAFRRNKNLPGWYSGLILAVSLAASGLLVWTANLGGKARHPEIRAVPPATSDD